MIRGRASRGGVVLSLLVALVVACGEGPVEPTEPRLEVVVVGGDAQFGTTGQTLTDRLRIQVRRADTGTPREGIPVGWSVADGDAVIVSGATGSTDGDGVASATLRLGDRTGTVLVEAFLEETPTVSVTFTAYVVERPVLLGLSTERARGGESLTLTGRGFSPVSAHNVVLFAGIRGRVLSATPSELTVEVPRCLPDRTLMVTVQLGTLVSQALSFGVESTATPRVLAPGEWIDVDDPEGLDCLRLSGSGGASYLAVPTSASTVGTARYPFVLRGLADVAAAPGALAAPKEGSRVGQPAPASFADRFERALRVSEAGLLHGRAAGLSPSAAPSGVPAVGETRTFNVLNADQGFDEVTAVARVVSDRAVLYVDRTAPLPGLDDADLIAFAEEFDEVIHPTVTGAFGVASDLDENERIAILFTPTVNGLTPQGSPGFVGGFFYGLDLLDREGSNRAEVFYALVPDPEGIYSDPRPKALVLDVTPAILAHEFQHMVHFNERVLKLEAEGTEALWLSEGLAQMAEELVARVHYVAAAPSAAQRYRAGNLERARRYLSAPAATSLIVVTGQGTLEERGAGWLFTLYLHDRSGGGDLLRRLTQTTRTGVDNVSAAVGSAWPELMADWAAALYLDGRSAGFSYPFEYPTVQLRDLIRQPGGAYPLAPEVIAATDFERTGSLWSSSADHYIVVPPSAGSIALRLGGEAGGGWPPGAFLRLRVIRLY